MSQLKIFQCLLTFFSANRFDKRVPTATRTWVSTQHSKIDDRPMFPVWNEEEKTEFQKQLEALE